MSEGAVNTNESALRRATGRDRDDWYALLDRWGAKERQYREIADWLTGEHRLSRWWAQKLIVEYQQDRGVRLPGSRPDGTFTTTASKTLAVSSRQVFEAVIDAESRQGWLPGVEMRERTSKSGRSARFDRADDGTRVNFTVTALGENKSELAVEHERLPDPRAAEEANRYWRDRLAALGKVLEAAITDERRPE